MNRLSVLGQVMIILITSMVLGLLNNLQATKPLEWFKAWPPYAAIANQETDPSSSTDDQSPIDEDQLRAEIEAMVAQNSGITDVDLHQARNIFQFAGNLTLWIDARSPELFEKGHIRGALLLDFYDQEATIFDVIAAIDARQTIALVVYCKGKECTDSHFLAEDLQALGYDNLFVYKDGFDDWFKAGLPVDGELAAAAANLEQQETSASDSRAQLLDEKPPGMYLEHVVRDLLPFFIGLFVLINWKRARTRKSTIALACIIVGIFFIWAGVPKILQPLAFAKSIWNYDLAPPRLINLAALIMPWLEVIGGGCMILGVYRRGGSTVVTGLLLLFIVVVGFNVLRGHEFNCGCVTQSTLLTEHYLPGWNDKYLLLLRDVGLLIMSILGLRQAAKDTRLEWPNP